MALRTLLLAVSLLVVGCGEWTPNRQVVTPSQPVNQVKLLSAQPAGGSVLSAGSPVTLKFAFSYELVTGDSATIQLVVSDQEHRTLNEPGNYPSISITRGTGTAELSYAMTVPASGVTSVVANFPMFVGTLRTSQTMEAIQYYVR